MSSIELKQDIVRKPLESPHDGHIERQIREQKVIPSVQVVPGEYGNTIVASRVSRNASAVAGIQMKKLYRRKPDGSYSFFYGLQGDMNNTPLTELNLLSEMLRAEFQNDYPLYFEDSQPVMQKTLETKLNTEHSMLYLYFEMKFEKEWNAPVVFREA